VVRLLANPIFMRAALVLFAAGAAFVFAIWLMRRLRQDIAAEADLDSGAAPKLDALPLHLYNTVIQQLKQQKHELQVQTQTEQRRARTTENFSQAVLSNLSSGVLVFGINGLDSRKEEVIARADRYLSAGVAVFAIDMPGTGQAPILIDAGAERMFSAALDYLATRQDVDAKRIVVQGRSWSGYWAAVLAYTEKDRIRGAVVHGVGIHEYFAPEWQKKAFSTREYLFDIYPARASVYGTKTMEEFLAYGPRLSLVARGLIDKPSAPMLLVNGERDTQQPIADLYLLMKHGDPKEVWVNPEGGHMGRSERWPQGKVLTEVVEPWVLQRLGVQATLLAQPPPKPAPSVSIKPRGGTGSNVGDDAPGGGARSAEPSKGGTRAAPKP